MFIRGPSGDRSKRSGSVDEGTPEVADGIRGTVCNAVEDTTRVDRAQGDNKSTHKAKRRRRLTNGAALKNIS